MPLFLVERTFPEQVDLSVESKSQINQVTAEIGVDWLSTFLSADKKKAYCLYEAKDSQQLIEQAQIVGLPVDAIIEVTKMWPLPDV